MPVHVFYHVVLLEVFRGQGKGAQYIVRFVSHRVNEGVHLSSAESPEAMRKRTRGKQAYVKGDLEGVVRGQPYCTCAFRPRQLSPFYLVTSRTLFRSPGPLLA